MEHFAGYGFNKSHSTAYAFLAYQTAYLKANYPWHFAAALLTIEAQNTDKLAMYLGECRERGIPLLPPDINDSQLRFTVEPGKGVRFGLTAIKNVGEGAIESLLEVRSKQGRITSLHALCEDLDLRLANKRVFESLIKAGAFDSVAQNGHGGDAVAGVSAAPHRRDRRGVRARRPASARPRRGAGPAVRRLRRCARRRPRERSATRRPLPEAPPWTETEQLAGEKETLGLYWSGHPVDRYAVELKALGARPTGELADAPVKAAAKRVWGPGGPKPIEPDTSIGGIVAACRQLKTRKGDRMAVFTLEDAQGSVEVIVFPEAYQRAAGLLEVGTMVLVRGKLERDDESVRILASEVLSIDTRRRAPGARGGDSCQDAGGPRRVRGARRGVPAPSRRSAGVLRDGARVGTDADAGARGRLGADSRQALAGARRRGRADRRCRVRCRCDERDRRGRWRLIAIAERPQNGFSDASVCSLVESNMAEPLEFEEPIAALLREIDELAELPQTDARDRQIETLRRRIETVRAGPLCVPDAVAARARRQASRASQPRGLHPAVVHRLCRDSRRSAVRRRPRDHDRICRLQGPAGPARRPRQGRRHEGKDLSQFRLRAARRVSQGVARDAAGGEVSPADPRLRRHAGRVSRASSPRNGASPRPLPSTCAR